MTRGVKAFSYFELSNYKGDSSMREIVDMKEKEMAVDRQLNENLDNSNLHINAKKANIKSVVSMSETQCLFQSEVNPKVKITLEFVNEPKVSENARVEMESILKKLVVEEVLKSSGLN